MYVYIVGYIVVYLLHMYTASGFEGSGIERRGVGAVDSEGFRTRLSGPPATQWLGGRSSGFFFRSLGAWGLTPSEHHGSARRTFQYPLVQE